MANNYSKFDDIMQELISGRDVSHFDGNSLKEFIKHQDAFWDGLLHFMQNQDTNYLGWFGVRQIDFPGSGAQSVVEYINDNADLVDSFLDTCLNGTDTHWNESFNQLLEYFNTMYDNNSEIDSTNMKINDILNANAGNSFNSRYDEEWVIPWENIDEDNYSEVRGNDKMQRVLDDKEYLQFTHMFNKYLRLLMPEYKREVQVEDLNRNFWVIGQVLTAICSYLFNDVAPLNELFNGMLDEITQLWENLLALWVCFSTVSQYDRYKTVQPIVVPMNSKDFLYFQQYDDFDRGTIIDDVIAYMQFAAEQTFKFNYVIDSFKESSLVIIPEVRLNSYRENYYAKAIYPGAIVVNRKERMGISDLSNNASNQAINQNKEYTFSYFPFLDENDNKFIVEITQGGSVKIFDTDITSDTWCLTDKNNKYHFYKPFSQNNGYGGDQIIAGIRTLFTTANLTIGSDYKTLSLSIGARCYDVAQELSGVGVSERLIVSYTGQKQNDEVTYTLTATPATSADTPPATDVKITKGWYRGEVVSWSLVNEPTFNINVHSVWTGGEPEDVGSTVVKLYMLQNGYRQYIKEITVTKDDADKAFTNLESYNLTGDLITYTFMAFKDTSSEYEPSYSPTQVTYVSVDKTFIINNNITTREVEEDVQ